MTHAKAKKNAERCPACRKPVTKVGHAGKFRCCNPECPVVFVRKDDYGEGESLSRRKQVDSIRIPLAKCV